MKEVMLTEIRQIKVKILSPEEHKGGVKGYNYNRPSSKWELVEYKGEVSWWPIYEYSLTTKMIDDYSKPRISL